MRKGMITLSSREQNKKIAEETIAILKQGSYIAGGKTVDIKDNIEHSISSSKLYKPGHSFSESQTENVTTTFEVLNETTLSGAKRLCLAGYENVTVLNFASAKNPGGGFLNGSMAQEESIARSSALYPCISQMKEMYTHNARVGTCLYSDYMIYSPQIPVFRDDRGILLSDPYFCSVITSPAVNAKVVKEREKQRIKEIIPVMKSRVEAILNVALEQKVNALVLGAFGCGVFENNPYDMANIFQEHLYRNPNFKNRFKYVTFAILDSSPSKTLFHMFKNIFK